MLQPLFCLFDRWGMPSRYPPQRVIHAVEPLEPRLALAHDLDMGRAVNKCTQLLVTFPDGKVDQDPVVVVRTKGRRITGVSLESPNKSGSSVRQRVDVRQSRDEPCKHRVVERRAHASNVDLRDMELTLHHHSP